MKHGKRHSIKGGYWSEGSFSEMIRVENIHGHSFLFYTDDVDSLIRNTMNTPVRGSSELADELFQSIIQSFKDIGIHVNMAPTISEDEEIGSNVLMVVIDDYSEEHPGLYLNENRIHDMFRSGQQERLER